MNYIGIDPGVSGGIAVVSDNGAHASKMPETERDVYNLLCDLSRDGAVAIIERVQAMPAHLRGRTQGVASTFKFGVGYGFLRGCLVGLNIPFVDVRPANWQKALGCLTHGDKNISKARAQQLYPALRVTHATADALLLATFCARQDWRGVGAPIVNVQPREAVPETSLF